MGVGDGAYSEAWNTTSLLRLIRDHVSLTLGSHGKITFLIFLLWFNFICCLFRHFKPIFRLWDLDFFLSHYVVILRFLFLTLILQVFELLLLGNNLLNFIELFTVIEFFFKILGFLINICNFLLLSFYLGGWFLAIIEFNRSRSLVLRHEFTTSLPWRLFFAARISRLNHQVGLGSLPVNGIQVILLGHQLGRITDLKVGFNHIFPVILGFLLSRLVFLDFNGFGLLQLLGNLLHLFELPHHLQLLLGELCGWRLRWVHRWLLLFLLYFGDTAAY